MKLDGYQIVSEAENWVQRHPHTSLFLFGPAAYGYAMSTNITGHKGMIIRLDKKIALTTDPAIKKELIQKRAMLVSKLKQLEAPRPSKG